MKMKVLFLTIALGIAMLGYSQKVRNTASHQLIPKQKVETAVIDNAHENFSPLNYTFNKELAAVPFTTSLNAFTLVAGKKMTADIQSKKVLYTARAGGAFGGTGNNIKMSFTSDFGNTWDSVLIVATESTHNLRYPGGTFFRPNGGDDLYVVAAGPISNGSGWIANFVASAKIDGQNFNYSYVNIPSGSELFHVNDGLKALPNGNLFIIGEKNGAAPDYPMIDYSIFKYIWNDTDKKFELSLVKEFIPNFADGMPPVQPYNIAFSEDGSVGYFWVNGQDSSFAPNLQTQPLIWKTTDGGLNWNMMPIFDFSTIQELKDYVWPMQSDTNTIRPVFSYGYTTSDKDMPGVVDKDGYLHLLSTIIGGYTSNPDSLNYTYVYEPNKIFDLYMTADGWNARYIDTLMSDVQYVESGGAGQFGDFTLDHRFHIAKSDDGNKIFALWTDTDPSFSTVNIVPDLKVWGHDLTTGNITYSKNFTQNTLLDGAVIYMNASDIVPFDNNQYKIPVAYVQATSTGDPTGEPIIHLYLKDVYFQNEDFVGINSQEISVSNVSQNYPNPFNDKTNIDVNIERPAHLSLDVMNIVGQVVAKYDAGFVGAGKHTFVVDGTSLKPGMYLYTIKADKSTITKKMLVK